MGVREKTSCVVPLFIVALLATTAFAGIGEADPKGLKDSINGLTQHLQDIAKQPLEAQMLMLRLVGFTLVASGQMPCNVFGGKAACTEFEAGGRGGWVESAPDSTAGEVAAEASGFAKVCPEGNPLVDCAFSASAEESLNADPRNRLRSKLLNEGFDDCPACFDVLHNFWCGQTAPTCGTFDKGLDVLLPAVQKVALGGVSAHDALAAAVPTLLQALSLGLPCREMCNQITKTCGCGDAATFGSVMESLEKRAASAAPSDALPMATNMSTGTARDLFAGVWDRPICELFAPKDTEGFIGTCQLSDAAAGSCKWCEAGQKRPPSLDAQIVAQMAQALSAMMQSGLQRIFQAAAPAVSGGVPGADTSGAAGRGFEPAVPHAPLPTWNWKQDWGQVERGNTYQHPDTAGSGAGGGAGGGTGGSAGGVGGAGEEGMGREGGRGGDEGKGWRHHRRHHRPRVWLTVLMSVVLVAAGGVGGAWLWDKYQKIRQQQSMLARYMDLDAANEYDAPPVL